MLDVIYRFRFSTSEEKEADQTKIEEDVLGNLPWFQAVVLRGEVQLSSAIERNLCGSDEKSNSDDPDEDAIEEPEEELRAAVTIAKLEENFLRQETYREIAWIFKIFRKLSASAAETYWLYHVYGMTECEIADRLKISHQAVSKWLEKAQHELREIVKQMRELLCVDVKIEI